jgi:CRP-like cAMP-binding protein
MKSVKKDSYNSKESNAADILRSTILFSNLNDDLFELFASEAVIKNYPKGKILFLHQDEAKYFYIIANGWVKLFRETLDGEEAVVDVLNNGHIFGETAIFDNFTYTYGAQAVEDSTILSLPISLLQEKIEENNKLSMQMLSSMSRFRKQQDIELEHMNLQSAPQRIGCFLLRLCPASSEEEITLNLPYDKTLIASRLGMKPETFSRALSRLRKETGIKINGSTIEIDKIEQLSNYSCNACSSSYPCQDLH